MQRTLITLYSCLLLMPWHGSAIPTSLFNPEGSSPIGNQTQAQLSISPQDVGTPAKPVSLGDVVRCAGDSTPAVLIVTTESGVTVDWFDTKEGGVVLEGGDSTPKFNPLVPLQNNAFTKSYFAQARDIATSSTNSDRTEVVLTINPRPTASLSGDTTVCPGQETTIQVALTGSAPWALTWSDGVQQISAGATATRLVSPTNNVVYYLTALSDHNCTASFSDLGDSVLLRVEPRLGATLTSITTNVCSGDTTRLRVAFTGRGPWTVTWSDGTISTATTTPALLDITPINPALNKTLTTNVTIAKLSNASCEAAPSDLKGKATLNVFPRPTAVVSGDATLCDGSTASIQAALTGIGPWTVVWSDGIIQNITSSPAKRTVKPNRSSDYRVTVLEDKNCPARAEDLTGVATVTILDRPTGTVVGGATLCNHDSTDIQVVLTGVGPWTVTWSDGLVQSNVLQSPLLRTVSGTNDGPASVVTNKYSLKSLIESDCRAQAADLGGEAVVRILSGPSATVTGTNTVCNGQPAVIQLALTGTGPWEVTWSDGVVQNVSDAKTNRLVNPLNPSSTDTTAVIYTVTNLTDSICTASTNRIKGRGLVNVYPKTTATVAGGGAICAGGSTVISAALTGTAPWALTWSDGFKQSTNGNVALRVVSPSSNTNLFLTDLKDKRCQAADSDLFGTATITLVDPPSAVVSGDLTQCAGTTNSIQAVLTGIGPWTLTWSDGLVQSNVLQSPVTRLVTPANNTTGNELTNRYFLTALSSGECQARKSDLTGEAVVVTTSRPTASVSGTSGTVCAGEPATLQITLTGRQPWTATWSDGEVQTYFSGSTNRVVHPTKLSSFKIVSLQDASCTALPTDITGNVRVGVNPAPAAPTSLGDVTNKVEGLVSAPLMVQTTSTNILVDWFGAATGGTPLAVTTNSFTPTNLVSGAYVYYAEARNAQSGCLSTNRTPVTLIIQPGLAVERLGASTQLLSWFGSYQLQSTTNLFLPLGNLSWVNVHTGAVSEVNRYTNSVSGTELFFRLFRP